MEMPSSVSQLGTQGKNILEGEEARYGKEHRYAWSEGEGGVRLEKQAASRPGRASQVKAKLGNLFSE